MAVPEIWGRYRRRRPAGRSGSREAVEGAVITRGARRMP